MKRVITLSCIAGIIVLLFIVLFVLQFNRQGNPTNNSVAYAPHASPSAKSPDEDEGRLVQLGSTRVITYSTSRRKKAVSTGAIKQSTNTEDTTGSVKQQAKTINISTIANYVQYAQLMENIATLDLYKHDAEKRVEENRMIEKFFYKQLYEYKYSPESFTQKSNAKTWRRSREWDDEPRHMKMPKLLEKAFFINLSFGETARETIEETAQPASFTYRSFMQNLWNLAANGNWELYDAVIRELPEELQNSYEGGNNTYLRFPPVKKVNSTKTKEHPADAAIREKLSSLTIEDFKKFYVFDEFVDDTCVHGEKVLDVIRQTLNNYGLDFAMQKIIKYPVNYYSNPDKGDSLHKLYFEKYSNDTKLKPVADSFDLVKFKGQNGLTPTRYLKEIYKLACEDTIDIISSSYIGESEFPYMMQSFVDSDTTVNYFAAAGNDNLDIDIWSKILEVLQVKNIQ